jgi:phosphoserine phosphatase
MAERSTRALAIELDTAFQSLLDATPQRVVGRRPLAVFDCDGTMIRGDIGEAMFFRQLEHFHFQTSPGEIWTDHPRRREIHGLFTVLSQMPPETRNTSEEYVLFADILTSWYYDQLAEKKTEKACTDIVKLFAGYTEQEVREIAWFTFDEEITSLFSERFIGRRPYPKGIRFIRETVDLITALRDHGFDLWIISGSNKWSVEPVAQQVGIPADQIIGIELETVNGYLSAKPKHPIPVRANKVRALKNRDTRIPIMVASDSLHDTPLWRYSSGVRVFVNSQGVDLDAFFAAAKIERDNSWIVVDHPTEVHAWKYF